MGGPFQGSMAQSSGNVCKLSLIAEWFVLLHSAHCKNPAKNLILMRSAAAKNSVVNGLFEPTQHGGFWAIGGNLFHHHWVLGDGVDEGSLLSDGTDRRLWGGS